MAKVIVLAGGNSSEREVSLRSGSAVQIALVDTGHTATIIDPVEPLETYLGHFKKAGVIFPALHGAGGEDGVVQKFCEDHSIPCVGPDSTASKLCFDKYEFGQLLQLQNILVPRTELIGLQKFEASKLIKNPYVLKPNDGGSSIDTFIVRDPAAADQQAIQAAFERHDKLVLQELIIGTEITIPILGDTALPVIEIVPPVNQEFDYENKYNGATQELCPPLNVPEALQRQAQKLTLKIHHLTGCQGMSRTDMIIRDGQLYILETNTIPGLTSQSLLPKSAAIAGITMPEMCDLLINEALSR